MEHPIEVLERYWNYTSFRPLQEEIIEAVLSNNDTFALLPTGGGKSICFQIPALIREGICIVISPLIALMKDQVHQLQQKGIKAIALTSGIPYSELDTLLDNCIYGNYKFLYLSPERLQQSIVQERIQNMNVNLIAVDEAHCISQWGNDFRPAYKNIKKLRELIPNANIIALTATAKQRVVEEILEELDFTAPKIFKASFHRENISYNVIKTEDKFFVLEHTLSKNPGTSIVYVRNRRAAEDINEFLYNKQFKSTFYHGGLDTNTKDRRLLDWSNDRVQIMVATTAFGMGIDKTNVRNIVHFNLPESLESYYQEAGRAGRDGKLAQAVLLKQNTDEDHLKSQFISTLPDTAFIKQLYKKLNAYFRISYGEGVNKTFPLNFNLFCTTYNFRKSITYNALKILDRNSVISLSQQFSYQTKLQFTVSNEVLFSYLKRNEAIASCIKVILRTYGGIFERMTNINIETIASKVETPQKQVLDILDQLEKDNIVSLIKSNTDTELTFLVPREDDKTINVIAKVIDLQNKIKKDQVNAVINYVNSTDVCLANQLLNYFNESKTEPCGLCSVCKKKVSKLNKETEGNIKQFILNSLKSGSMSSRDIIRKTNYPETEIINALRELLEENEIEITPSNKYKRR